MPSFSQEIEATVPQEAAWTFVRTLGNWASLFPGYQRHLEVDDDNFVWQIRGESGVWSRLVEFEVHVQEWNEPGEVRFALRGKTEPVTGTGRFSLKPTSDQATAMGFELTAEGRGPTAPLLNALLKKFVAEQSGPFLERLVAAMQRSGGAAAALDSAATAAAVTADSVAPTPVPGTPATAAPVTPANAAPDSAATSVAGSATAAAPSTSTAGGDEFPVGPGVIVVRYEAPRTRQFEEWLHGPHYDDLLGQPAVVRVSRFEQIGTAGPLGCYLALIHSSDLATTMRHRTTAGVSEQQAANDRGLVRGETYLARVVYDRRRNGFSRLLSRLRGRSR